MGQRLVDNIYTSALHARHTGCLCRPLVGGVLELARISDVTLSSLGGFFCPEAPEDRRKEHGWVLDLMWRDTHMKKFLKFTGVTLLGTTALGLLFAYAAYPAEYVNRVLLWGDSDVYDYRRFPGRPLETSGTPFEFPLNLDEDYVRTQFELASGMADFDSFLERNRTQAFIVIHNDTILYEGYFGQASRDSMVTSFSIAKSFTSALIGIAISEGYIHSVNDPV